MSHDMADHYSMASLLAKAIVEQNACLLQCSAGEGYWSKAEWI